HQGVIQGTDGHRMSKSRRNVVLPDAMVQEHGADAVRLFLMFIGPWDQGGPWNPQGFEGIPRFLNRVWAVVTEAPNMPGSAAEAGQRGLGRLSHKTWKKVPTDLERFGYNTAIAALMEYVNGLTKARQAGAAGTRAWEEARRLLTLMLAPMAPHIAE